MYRHLFILVFTTKMILEKVVRTVIKFISFSEGVMNGRPFKKPLLPSVPCSPFAVLGLKIAADKFCHKDSAKDGKKELFMNDDGHDGYCSSNR